ncbi:MAG: sel1 repeat family protein, partial [Sulfurovum sp.]
EASGCNNLGNMYEEGTRWVRKDSVKAERFYSLACDLDDQSSCDKLGYVYGKRIRRILSEEDKKIAQRACDYGNGVSCYKLGELYYTKNKLVEKDIYEAIKFFNKACDMGQSNSCRLLGDIHKKGY